MAKGLTAKKVENAKPGSVRQEIPDGTMPGLYLIVQPSGVKSWALRYRLDGRTRKHTIGKCPPFSLSAARQQASMLHLAIAEGRDPRRERVEAKVGVRSSRKKPKLFEEVVDEFITKHAEVKTKGADEVKKTLYRHYVSRWKGRNIKDITKDDVIQAIDDLVEQDLRAGATKSFAHLRKMFNWAVGRNILETSPCDRIENPFNPVSRDRVLSDAEIVLFWDASGRMGYPFGDFFRMLFLTLQRRSEVSDARWREFDAGLWGIPASRAKNENAQDLQLTQFTLDIMNNLPRMAGSPYLFTTTGRTPISGFSKAKKALDAKMLEVARENAIKRGEDPSHVVLEHFINHDLRRTATTKMAKLGIPPHVCEALLNHKSGTISGVAAVYNRWQYNDEKSEALRVWNAYVKQLVAGADLSEEGE